MHLGGFQCGGCWLWRLVLHAKAYAAAPIAELSEDALARSCRRGRAEACTELGRIEQKKGNDPKAVEWYREACGKADPAACCNLGVAYWLGRGVTKDVAQATKTRRFGWCLLDSLGSTARSVVAPGSVGDPSLVLV